MKKNKKSIIIFLSLILMVILIPTMIFLVRHEKLTKKNSVSVYFVKNLGKGNFKLEAVRRKIHHGSTKIVVAINELLKGPSEKEKKEGYYTEIPTSTKLIDILDNQEGITINLSDDFESGGGSTSMIMRLKQLSNTSLDATEDKPVYLELNDKDASTIGGEGLMVPHPLTRNLSDR